MEEIDNQFVLIDIKHTQKLNGWGVSASLFMELTTDGNKVVVTANGSGGNGNYKYDFYGNGNFSKYNNQKFCVNKDTLIRVIVADFEINTTTFQPEQISIPDTAYLEIKVSKNNNNCIFAAIEFDYESVNDSTRKYTAKNGEITTILTTTGGSMKYYVGGFEVFVSDITDIDAQEELIYKSTNPFLRVTKITDIFMEIFEWLKLLDTNAFIIIVLMIVVAIINIIALLLVLIIEKINMIGILKSFGSSNLIIQKIFIRMGASILLKGIVIGNAIALIFIFLQKQFGIITLPQEKYYLSKVPLDFEWIPFIVVNLVTIVISITILFLTSLFISKLTPVKAIKFE